MGANDSAPTEVDQDEGRFVIYVAYGEIMHKFQVFELLLWGFLTRSIKSGMTTDQALARIGRWDSTTLGSMWRGLRTQNHWPVGLVAKVDEAVVARNYLAHHFLREYFVVRPSMTHHQDALANLAEICVRLDALTGELEAHSRGQGIVSIEDLGRRSPAGAQCAPSDVMVLVPNRDRR